MTAGSNASPATLATLDVNWGGSGYPTYDGLASAAAVASPATEGGGAAPAAAPAQGGAGSGAATGTETQSGTSSQPNPNEANLRTLRENHDRYKGEAERYGKLGTFEQVQAAHQHYTKVTTEVSTLGKQLGYTDADVAEAVAADPYKALQYLRQEAAQASRDPRQQEQLNLQKEIDRRIKEGLRPYEQAQQRQVADKANAAFTGEVNRILDTKFAGVEAMPAELREPFMEVVSEFMSFADPQDIEALKNGNVSVVEKTFNEAFNFMTKLGAGYVKWENSRRGAAGTNNAGAAGGAKPKLSLNDIIEGNEKAKANMQSFR